MLNTSRQFEDLGKVKAKCAINTPTADPKSTDIINLKNNMIDTVHYWTGFSKQGLLSANNSKNTGVDLNSMSRRTDHIGKPCITLFILLEPNATNFAI